MERDNDSDNAGGMLDGSNEGYRRHRRVLREREGKKKNYWLYKGVCCIIKIHGIHTCIGDAFRRSKNGTCYGRKVAGGDIYL